MAFPFTSAQWKELERQATIYKYILSSLPVPPHLLFPDSSLSSKSISSFVEPGSGRCKRTDGKKWRCSRDVAPYHKYCDRHLHRGRPRSRKPVELHADNNPKRSRFQQTNYDDPKTDLNISTAPRDLGLIFGTEKRWAQPNMGFANEALSVYGSSSVFDQDYVEQNVLHYSNFPDINIELPPACFTDHAYSSNNGTEPVSPSLNLSIGSFSGQEMADSRWLGIGSSGGPLAEALGSNSASSPITL